MTPKVGEVYILDLGYEGKVRPVVIMSREDPAAPRALALFVPPTRESRPSHYEVTMPRVPWLKHQSYANIQAIGAAEFHELTNRRGRFEAPIIAQLKDAIRYAFDL